MVAHGDDIPFPDDAFDLTYSVAVMHHIAEPPLVRRTLAEMVRVTRPGGRILVWDHNPLNPLLVAAHAAGAAGHRGRAAGAAAGAGRRSARRRGRHRAYRAAGAHAGVSCRAGCSAQPRRSSARWKRPPVCGASAPITWCWPSRRDHCRSGPHARAAAASPRSRTAVHPARRRPGPDRSCWYHRPRGVEPPRLRFLADPFRPLHLLPALVHVPRRAPAGFRCPWLESAPLQRDPLCRRPRVGLDVPAGHALLLAPRAPGRVQGHGGVPACRRRAFDLRLRSRPGYGRDGEPGRGRRLPHRSLPPLEHVLLSHLRAVRHLDSPRAARHRAVPARRPLARSHCRVVPGRLRGQPDARGLDRGRVALRHAAPSGLHRLPGAHLPPPRPLRSCPVSGERSDVGLRDRPGSACSGPGWRSPRPACCRDTPSTRRRISPAATTPRSAKRECSTRPGRWTICSPRPSGWAAAITSGRRPWAARSWSSRCWRCRWRGSGSPSPSSPC